MVIGFGGYAPPLTVLFIAGLPHLVVTIVIIITIGYILHIYSKSLRQYYIYVVDYLLTIYLTKARYPKLVN